MDVTDAEAQLRRLLGIGGVNAVTCYAWLLDAAVGVAPLLLGELEAAIEIFLVPCRTQRATTILPFIYEI